MLWLEVVLITITLCSEVSQLWIYTNFNVFRTVLPEFWPTPIFGHSHITPVRKALYWLPIKYHSIFQIVVLVYKFLHSGNPKYFEPFLIPTHNAYNTHPSQSDGMFLEFPYFVSVFKSRKHYELSYAYDAPMIWNNLPDKVRSGNSLTSLRSKLKSYLFGKACPPLQCLWFMNIEQCFWCDAP